MERIYEYCYIKRDMMLHDISKVTFVKKMLFKIVDYFANKY